MEHTTLGVTTRELGRHAAALLDEIEKNGRYVVICRYGRPVAFLGPLPEDYEPGSFERLHVAPRFEAMAPFGTEQDPDLPDDEIEQLGEEERSLIALVDTAAPYWWMPQTKEELAITARLVRLEMRDLLIGRAGGGWKVSPRGRKAASRT